MTNNKYSLLFQLTFRSIKFFFLAIIGLSIALFLAMGVGALGMAIQIFPLVFTVICRVGIIILCFIATTMIVESLR
ncbi:MAG: hypothetical protein QNJ63_24600 [Calothrix sp. MO_192.B10]|nr:hypothetical protein [Calothrix sp. MO_192.B10]